VLSTGSSSAVTFVPGNCKIPSLSAERVFESTDPETGLLLPHTLEISTTSSFLELSALAVNVGKSIIDSKTNKTGRRK
jgi:hypothetical protein